MKTLIVGVAIAILYSAFLIFQMDNNLYLIKLEELKAVSNECSAAALYYDTCEYREGLKVFNREEGNKAIRHLICNNLKLDENFFPKVGSYWTDKVGYNVFYIDDSGFIYEYYNNGYIGRESFAYGSLYTDPIEGYQKVITEPTVIVTIVAGKPKYRLSLLGLQEICAARSSAYEYVRDKGTRDMGTGSLSQ